MGSYSLLIQGASAQRTGMTSLKPHLQTTFMIPIVIGENQCADVVTDAETLTNVGTLGLMQPIPYP
jgi:hypothetical protein